ncbi:mannose-1-phosphate guanylyltransferase [Desulfoferrobacter suflitae]|uniref:mannose-1-phosphate guanylyltransferase n=1 Tax=Desulfoferrobacter suflitae TaxID=2865782 RepID=UPI002164C6ED|nr:sugar phosphate nucleotidyltransferase [Desulfoferrobacter suflitae]MCK8600477.1 sugar phosphate nucleotidyltransferase [Desulfoferrobacter suflitae]
MASHENNLVATIMAGGSGTRFWPLSTREKPKQFVRLFDDRSLLQKSYDRMAGILPDERILILTNERFTELVREQLPRIPSRNIIGEPMRKDTAAAVCLGALIARKRFGNPVIITSTADHLIEPVDQFRQTMLSAAEQALHTGALYTCGIRPDYPATGYGYLQVGEKIQSDKGVEHFRVESFKEKPDVKIAEMYLAARSYLWNSGMFVWTADAILAELSRHLPTHVEYLSDALEREGTIDQQDALRNAFAAIERISIDYAVMEKAENVCCVAGEFSWKDVGGWLAMQDYLPSDANCNFVRGSVHTLDGRNNLIFCDGDEETVALVGLSDVVLVRAGPNTLLAHKDRLEDVKTIVEAMTAEPR